MYPHIDFLIMVMCLFDLVWVFCFVVEVFFGLVFGGFFEGFFLSGMFTSGVFKIGFEMNDEVDLEALTV